MPQETYYYKFPDGSVSARTVEFDGDVTVDPKPPPGAVAIPAAVYQVLVAELEQATELLLATLHGEEQQRAQEDFEALTAAGIPLATARRLSGYRDDGNGSSQPLVFGGQS